MFNSNWYTYNTVYLLQSIPIELNNIYNNNGFKMQKYLPKIVINQDFYRRYDVISLSYLVKVIKNWNKWLITIVIL